MNNPWLSMLFNSDQGIGHAGTETVVFVLLLSFAVGHFIGWVYMWTHKGLSYSQTFTASLVVIPALVALMILLMAGSLIFAFGLLAVFAVVRFRNVLKDTRDTTFILWAIMEGLAAGTLRYSTALIGAIGVAGIFAYLGITSFGSRHRYDAVLSLRLTQDLAGSLRHLKQILRRHCSRTLLATERRLSDEGLDLSYRLLLRDPTRQEELKWDLTQKEGFENISLFMRDDEAEI
ncbi:MAG: hypothetical protein A2W31_03600 [Planctomycetes bacterium RBG_16_64_10]|nr:MAG: hypothetical protein A2W31_03600 [Planctomycetes bacterium RBG_16_64_10]